MRQRPTTPEMEAALPLIEKAPVPLPPFLYDEKLANSLTEEISVDSVDVQSLREHISLSPAGRF